MGYRIKMLTSSLLAASLLASNLGMVMADDSCSNITFAPNNVIDGKTARNTPTPTPDDVAEVVPLTEEDIQEMNDGEAIIVYSDEGYVTTIVGKVYDTPVHTYAELDLVIGGLRDLLGLTEDYELEPVVQDYLNDGITFTFRQMDGEYEIANSTLKILIDEDNIPVMVQSSLVPNYQPTTSGDEITAEEAEDVIADMALNSGIPMTIFSDYTSTCVLNDIQIPSTRCYRIYTDNPFASQGTDMPYLIHYVDFEGNYLKNYPTNNLNEENLDQHDNDAYFENLVATDYEFTVMRNGEEFTFTVPVSYNTVEDTYYLADPERKIILADFHSFIYEGVLDFESSDDPEDWSDNHLITYYNYTQSYDYYSDTFNFYSTDGFGIPILILTGWCSYDGTPVNNQCSMGIINGWSAFGASDINTYAYSMDVTTHEYTHAITAFLRQGNLYYNEYGAINEGFSDIMGNIAEMRTLQTDDVTWALGETSGNTVRSMSDPTLYGQPVMVGDPYYSNTIALPNSGASSMSDNGGVHSNDSLFSHLCYVLYDEGMSLTRLSVLFYQALLLHTPKADYDDIYAILIASARMQGYDEYIPVITSYFEEAGMLGDRIETVRTTSNDGYARFNLNIEPADYSLRSVLLLQNVQTDEIYTTTAMEDGSFSICVPATDGWVILLMVCTDSSFSEVELTMGYAAGQAGWTDDPEEVGVYNLNSGMIAELDDVEFE